jgi:endonuclease/exonuclease/phosphatase family metal-dependent hydrolase
LRYPISVAALVLVGACAHLNRSAPLDARLVLGDEAHESRGARGSLRIATYNVHGESAENIFRAIRGNPPIGRADVLFLQEIEIDSENTPRRLAELLGRSYAYAPGYRVGHGSHGVAIISRHAISDPEVIELPRHDVVFNSARRVALAVTVHLDGRAVRLYNVHLDNRLNPADRVAQLEPVLVDARLAATVPAVIGGDMNTSPFCWIGHVIPVPCGVQDNRLEAAARASGFDTPVRGSGATSQWLAMRLDAIYTRHLRVEDFGVSDLVRVSDHLPLWVDVRRAQGAVVTTLPKPDPSRPGRPPPPRHR